uniref:Serine-threonine/tyrosine-protein kinase catalytic domain-containing protein n=1 Tax=Oryza brachyantha TaxID=4533 RepID=J3MVW7_ORYBR
MVEEHLNPLVGAGCPHVRQEMLLVLRIPVLCTAKLPRDRPSMRDIITMLGEAKTRRQTARAATPSAEAAPSPQPPLPSPPPRWRW